MRSADLVRHLVRIASVLALAGGAAAQPCPGQGSATLRLTSNTPPAAGVRITLEVTGAPLQPFAVAADVGPGPVFRPRVGTICLDLGPGLRVVTNGIRDGSPRLDPTGRAVLNLTLPGRQSLGGRTYYLQAFVADPAAPSGFAISPRLDLAVGRAIAESFRSTGYRDAAATTASWTGDGFAAGRSTPAREVLVGPFIRDSVFLPDFLHGSGATCQMIYESERLGIAPGESILGMSWSPDGRVTATTYYGIRLLLCHSNYDRAAGGLSPRFFENYDEAPTQVFAGNYTTTNETGNGWYPWPPFSSDFPYDGVRPLLFEARIPPGATAGQAFRGEILGGGLVRMQIGAHGDQESRTGENAHYETLFRVALVRTVAQSLFYNTGLENPDYSSVFVTSASSPSGTQVGVDLEGADDADRDGLPDAGSLTGFVGGTDLIDGKQLVRFRIRFRANETTAETPSIDAISIHYR